MLIYTPCMHRLASVALAITTMSCVACSASGNTDGSSGVDSGAAHDTASEASDEGGSCLFTCDVPAPTCKDACTSVVSSVSSCAGGLCKFDQTSKACPTGCNSTNGQCDSSGCAKVACGDKGPCGDTCDDPTTCCVKSTYDRTTGAVSGSGKACCDAGDVLTGTEDCGVGMNHGVNVDGTCADAWEGAGNGGTACATAHCEKLVCPTGP